MTGETSGRDSLISIDSDFAEESAEGKLVEAMAEWFQYFPNTEFSTTVFNDLLEDCETRHKEINQLYQSAKDMGFDAVLKYDRFLQYSDELSHLYEVFNAIRGESYSHFPLPEYRPLFHRIRAKRFWGELKGRYPLLDEFETASPMEFKNQSSIASGIYAGILNGKKVAVKYLPITSENEACLMEYLARYRAIFHEAVPPIRQVFADCRVTHGVPQTFLCMATDLADNLCEGDIYYEPLSLKVVVENGGAVGINESIAILSPVAAALERIHKLGFEHGNLTWNNVLFFENHPCLTDATLHCRDHEERRSLLPPEHASGLNSDIAGFGLVLYSLISGLSPECYPKMPLEAMRQPLWREVNSFILRCCAPKTGTRFPFEEFNVAWEDLRCRNS